jgi:hypothetical protein
MEAKWISPWEGGDALLWAPDEGTQLCYGKGIVHQRLECCVVIFRKAKLWDAEEKTNLDTSSSERYVQLAGGQ